MLNSDSLRFTFAAMTILLITGVCPVQGQTEQSAKNRDWAQFLGDGSNELRTASSLTNWDESNYRWQAQLPGIGWSSPVYSGDRIWLTSAVVKPATKEQIAEKRKGVQFAETKTVAGSIELRAICVDLETGKLIHNIALTQVDSPDLINPLNSYASPTPAISQGRVVCHFGAYGTWCLDVNNGETLWKTKYVIDHSVGPGSSPIILDEKVILVCDGIDKQFVAAVKLSDGQEVWNTARPPMRNKNGEYQKAYSTPLVIEVGGKQQLVIPGAQWIAGYEPASGKEIWRVDHGEGFSVTPMASFEGGNIVFSTGFMRPEVIAIDPGGTGDVTATHIKWRTKNGPNMPSMLTSDGKVYYISDKGIMYCANAMTGEVLKRKRLAGNYSATPLLVGGHIYVSSREGRVFVIKADESLDVVATNVFDGTIMASPAPVENDLIFRVGNRLYRIGKTAG